MDYLQGIFPDKLPENPVTAETLAVSIGAQKVIRHLKAQLDKQTKAVLVGPT